MTIKLPAGHPVQVPLAASKRVQLGQAKQMEAPAGDIVRAPVQPMHRVQHKVEQYVLGEQALHTTPPPAAYLPMGHFEQPVIIRVETEPAGQSEQVVAPIADA